MDDIEAAERAVKAKLDFLFHMSIEERGVAMMADLMGLPEILQTSPPGSDFSGLISGAEALRTAMFLEVSNTEVFAATDEICDLLSTVAPTWPQESIDFEDIIVPNGTVWFSKPLHWPPGEDSGPPFRMITWSLFEPSNWLLSSMGREHINPVILILGYCDLEHFPRKKATGQFPDPIPVVSIFWEVNIESGGAIYDPLGEYTRSEVEAMRRPYVQLLMSYWAIIAERMTEVAEPNVKISPKWMKRAKRKYKDFNDTIRVVRLKPSQRTVYTGDHGFNRPNWSVRWLVRPHFRRQYHPSTGTYKIKLIQSYVKGPDDAPLTGTERAFLPPPPKEL